MALTLVLSVGLDAALLSARNFVLQSAGYFVVPAFSLNEAVNRFQGGDFDLVLLCQSIPTKEKDRLTCGIRASGSRIPVVSVSEKLGEIDGFANATVASDPNALLMGIRELVINVATPVAWAAAQEKREITVAQGKQPLNSRADYEQGTKTNKNSLSL